MTDLYKSNNSVSEADFAVYVHTSQAGCSKACSLLQNTTSSMENHKQDPAVFVAKVTHGASSAFVGCVILDSFQNNSCACGKPSIRAPTSMTPSERCRKPRPYKAKVAPGWLKTRFDTPHGQPCLKGNYRWHWWISFSAMRRSFAEVEEHDRNTVLA